MNMELITSAASDALVNVVLAIIALAGAYGVYYIRLGAAKLKEQTAQIKDEAGRWGDPEDMVGPCVFLASHASDFVNGQILYADGGILAYIGRQPK